MEGLGRTMIYHVCSTLLMIGVLGLVAQVLLGGCPRRASGQHRHAGTRPWRPCARGGTGARVVYAVGDAIAADDLQRLRRGGRDGPAAENLRLPPTWVVWPLGSAACCSTGW